MMSLGLVATQVAAVKFLLEWPGEDSPDPDCQGGAPLVAAASRGDKECVRVLLGLDLAEEYTEAGGSDMEVADWIYSKGRRCALQ